MLILRNELIAVTNTRTCRKGFGTNSEFRGAGWEN